MRVSLAWPQTAQTGEEEGGMKRRMTFQANQALAALDSDLKACVVGKISFYLQPASARLYVSGRSSFCKIFRIVRLDGRKCQ